MLRMLSLLFLGAEVVLDLFSPGLVLCPELLLLPAFVVLSA